MSNFERKVFINDAAQKLIPGYTTKSELKKRQLDNALNRIAKGCVEEEIIGMFDITVFSSGKNGFVFTENGIFCNDFNILDSSVGTFCSFDGIQEIIPADKKCMYLDIIYKSGDRKRMYFAIFGNDFFAFLNEIANTL